MNVKKIIPPVFPSVWYCYFEWHAKLDLIDMKSMRLISHLPTTSNWDKCMSERFWNMKLFFSFNYFHEMFEQVLQDLNNYFKWISDGDWNTVHAMRLQVAHLGIVILHGLHLAIIFITASVQPRDEISIKMTCCFVTLPTSPYEMIRLFS